jgi:hypothetical protein
VYIYLLLHILNEHNNIHLQQCFKHLPKQKPQFHNLPEEWTGDIGLFVENEVAITPGILNLQACLCFNHGNPWHRQCHVVRTSIAVHPLISLLNIMFQHPVALVSGLICRGIVTSATCFQPYKVIIK